MEIPDITSDLKTHELFTVCFDFIWGGADRLEHYVAGRLSGSILKRTT